MSYCVRFTNYKCIERSHKLPEAMAQWLNLNFVHAGWDLIWAPVHVSAPPFPIQLGNGSENGVNWATIPSGALGLQLAVGCARLPHLPVHPSMFLLLLPEEFLSRND